MQRVKATTKQGRGIIEDSRREGYGSIWHAYNTCSDAKQYAYCKIEDRARRTEGYNHDLRVIGKNCMMFSTIYTFNDEEGTHIIKDTAYGTYEVVI